jgi:putative FmdB family regulatory protein
MPIFEYACETCGATFERLTLRPQAGVPMPCPDCGSVQTTKVFSTFSTQAGSGGSPMPTMGAPAFR